MSACDLRGARVASVEIDSEREGYEDLTFIRTY